jgi:NAD dependent epimerase/dehydratase
MEWRERRVFVTGADGFIGSHLVEALVAAGARVTALSYYNAFGHWGWLDALPRPVLDSIEVVAGDVRDPAQMRAAVRGHEVVFHLAALIGIPYSYLAPDSYVDTNIKGTLNILNACNERGVGRLVVTSTSEVYGTARRVPIDESHPLQPQSPYSASKIAADAMAESFWRAFGLPVIIARPFNTYGPRQSARAVIPTIITQVLAGSDRVKLGSLHPTRDLLYVEDTCRGFLALAACDAAIGRAVNMGTGREVSIVELAGKLLAPLGSRATIVSEDERVRPEASEVERLLCDASLMKELTGWEARVTLDEGLARTVAWFRSEAGRFGNRWETYNV